MNTLVKGIVLGMVMGIIFTIIVFSTLFVQNVNMTLTDELVTKLNDTATNLDLDPSVMAAINSQKAKLDSFSFKIDLILMTVFAIFVMLCVLLAIITPPLSKFNFLTLLFIGSFLLSLAANFIKQIHDYLRENFITNVFTAVETNLPFYNWYMDNYGFVFFGLFSLILLVNQLKAYIPSGSVEQQLEDEVIEE